MAAPAEVRPEEGSLVLLNVIFGAFSALAITVTLWSLAVAWRPSTTESVRKHAREVFAMAWKTTVVAVLITLVRLYATGAFNAIPSTIDPSMVPSP